MRQEGAQLPYLRHPLLGLWWGTEVCELLYIQNILAWKQKIALLVSLSACSCSLLHSVPCSSLARRMVQWYPSLIEYHIASIIFRENLIERLSFSARIETARHQITDFLA
jgi:hypothetical protein